MNTFFQLPFRLPVFFSSLVSVIRVGTCAVIAVCGLVAFSPAADDGTAKQPFPYPFYAFDNAFSRNRLSFDEQAKLLKELGYDGISLDGTKRIPEMLKALDNEGLKMFSIYTGACVDPRKPPYDSGLKKAIERLRGRDTVIWLFVIGGKPSSDASDERAVVVLREIADMAADSGLRVALYPHVNCYVQRIEDGLRLVKKVDRKNLGLCFNLCHFLKLDSGKNLERRLTESAPHLFSVSINGTDGGETNAMKWDRLIQTLDRGNFDVGRVLKRLRQLNYAGPIGLQCYAVPGDSRDNLTRSMSAWRKLISRLDGP